MIASLGCFFFERDAGGSSVPGCIGDATQIGDGTKAFYIEPPKAKLLVVLGQQGLPHSAFPLGKCQGNCQQGESVLSSVVDCLLFEYSNLIHTTMYPAMVISDSDCQEGLKCLRSDDSVASLSCKGKGVVGFNYCFSPLKGEKFLEYIGNYEMDYYELSACQGDCDFDSGKHICTATCKEQPETFKRRHSSSLFFCTT